MNVMGGWREQKNQEAVAKTLTEDAHNFIGVGKDSNGERKGKQEGKGLRTRWMVKLIQLAHLLSKWRQMGKMAEGICLYGWLVVWWEEDEKFWREGELLSIWNCFGLTVKQSD